MREEEKPLFIYTTFENVEDAKRVGGALVEAKLAACVNIFPSMVSIYRWQGKLEQAQEAAMIIKTRHGLKDDAMREARRLHPYETPALLQLNVDGGDPDYLAWMHEQTRLKSG